jgi:SAM-dependent methyltransferase
VASSTDAGRERHWERIYDTRRPERLSWYQPYPAVSLELIEGLGPARDAPIVDVGGGASTLVDELLRRGHTDLTVLDISADALGVARRRLGASADRVRWEHTDLLDWAPGRRYAIWHDRAVFHFLTDPADADAYRALATASVAAGGHLILATFAADGPDHCSGLPVARYDPDRLAARFAPAFAPVADRREHHRTPTGAEQRFTWLVLCSRLSAGGADELSGGG